MKFHALVVSAIVSLGVLAGPANASAEPSPVKPAAPRPSQADPTVSLVCGVVQAYPGGRAAIEAQLATIAAAELQLVGAVNQHVPGVEEAFTTAMAPIDAHITELLAKCQ